MKYAGYARISSDEQVGNYSLDAQKKEILAWVKARGGVLVNVYVDEAQSGRTSNRPAFLKMRSDARRRLFDAVVVHKFDRFARNRAESLAIKSLLRSDYGVKVFSVSEPSEDSDGVMGALIEGIMESVADWYSRNLGAEVSKGLKERSAQGYHNNQAPFGFVKDENKLLVPVASEVSALQLVFESYATGNYGYSAIAKMLNDRGNKTKSGRRFTREAIRDLLQNRIYIGKVRYTPNKKGGSGRRRSAGEVTWSEGKHDAVINEQLFEKCQRVRKARRQGGAGKRTYKPYTLKDLAYCYGCCCNRPDNAFSSHGKLRVHTFGNGGRYLRCRGKEIGVSCDQKGVKLHRIEEQVVQVVSSLIPPTDWKQNIVKSIGILTGELDAETKIKQVKMRIKRMDFRWDNGFIEDEQEFMEQRVQLQYELEQLQPVSTTDLENCVGVLRNFRELWEDAAGDVEKQKKLLGTVVQRIYIKGDSLKAVTLNSNYHLVMGHNVKEPTPLNEVGSSYAHGDGETRTLTPEGT